MKNQKCITYLMFPEFELCQHGIQKLHFSTGLYKVLVYLIVSTLRQRVFQQIRMITTLPQLHHNVLHANGHHRLGRYFLSDWTTKISKLVFISLGTTSQWRDYFHTCYRNSCLKVYTSANIAMRWGTTIW